MIVLSMFENLTHYESIARDKFDEESLLYLHIEEKKQHVKRQTNSYIIPLTLINDTGLKLLA